MSRVPALILVAALCLAVPATAAAKTFEPTRKDDPVPNGCKPKNCSLREAIDAATAHTGPDKVALGRGTYKIERPGDENQNESGSFDPAGEISIRGKGPSRTTINGKEIDNVFGFFSFGRDSLRGLTVRGGLESSLGGGINVASTAMTLKDVVVRDNSGEQGGGIFSVASDLRIVRSTIRGNDASGGGGGLFMRATSSDPAATLTSSTISGNSAGIGGGAHLDGFNIASGSPDPPQLDVLNSTFAGNMATVSGGGISAIQGATVDLDNATVAYNAADFDDASGGDGGGVHQSTGAVFGLGDSVIAENEVGSSGVGAQCQGSFANDSDGLVRQNQPSGTCSFGGTFMNVDDALIGPLADNGGPTETVRVLGGSPAIGFAGSCPKRDQRGRLRPANCDSSAFENKPRRG